MTLEEKMTEMTDRVKQKLDDINYRITMIFTTYDKDGLLRDGTRKELLATTFTEALLDRSIHVYSDPDTLEMLYIQTGPMNFVEVDTYFAQE